MFNNRFRKTADTVRSGAFLRQYAVVMLLLILAGFLFSFLRQLVQVAIDFWRIALFNYVPLLQEFRDSGLERILALTLSVMSTGFIAWGWLFYRNHRCQSVTGKLRRLQPVLVRHAPSRWQLGFRLSENEVQLGADADSNIIDMDPIYMPSFPIPATGQMEFVARDSYALVHNPWDEIALFIARGGINRVRWIITDSNGNHIEPEQLINRSTPLITHD